MGIVSGDMSRVKGGGGGEGGEIPAFRYICFPGIVFESFQLYKFEESTV